MCRRVGLSAWCYWEALEPSEGGAQREVLVYSSSQLPCGERRGSTTCILVRYPGSPQAQQRAADHTAWKHWNVCSSLSRDRVTVLKNRDHIPSDLEVVALPSVWVPAHASPCILIFSAVKFLERFHLLPVRLWPLLSPPFFLFRLTVTWGCLFVYRYNTEGLHFGIRSLCYTL